MSRRAYIGPRQRAALDAVAAHWRAYGESPTRAELGRALGITAVSAHLLAGKLASAGLLIVAPRVHRGMEVAAAASERG